jgi:hypothetical protein
MQFEVTFVLALLCAIQRTIFPKRSIDVQKPLDNYLSQSNINNPAVSVRNLNTCGSINGKSACF